MEKKKKILLYIAVITAVIIAPFLFKEQIKGWSKRNIFLKVVQKQDMLLDLVERYRVEGEDAYIHLGKEDKGLGMIPYKKLKDKEMTRAFKEFHLDGVHYDENGNVIFSITPSIYTSLKDMYRNGFYYSDEDIKEEEVEEDDWWIHKWYRTEKITEHWGYFEEKTFVKNIPEKDRKFVETERKH